MNQAVQPGRFKVWLTRLRTLLWTALSLVILLSAVLVGVGKLLMPYSARYQPQLEAWLSEEFNQPVKVDAFTGEWKAFGPRISLSGLNLLGAPGQGESIAIQQAALDIKPLNALIAGRPLYSFRIIGADLELLLAKNGSIELSGLGVTDRVGQAADAGSRQQSEGGSGLGNLARVGEVRLEQSRLRFIDRQRNIELELAGLNGRVSMNGSELAAEVQASMTDALRGVVLGDLGATVQLELDQDNRVAAARWHVDAGELLLSALANQFPPHELKPLSGRVNAELWGEWKQGQAQTMEGVVDVRDLAFEAQPTVLQVDRLNSVFRWRFHDKRKWRIDLAEVEIEENARQWSTPRLSVERHIAGGLGMWVSADYLDVQLPLALTQRILASVSGRWPANMPTDGSGRVRDFDIVFNADKKLAAVRGQAGSVDIYEWGRWPRVEGLSAQVNLVNGEGQADVQGDDVRVSWPRNFRAPLNLSLPGCTLEVLWGDRWQIDAQGCELRSDAADLTGRARFVGNSGKPYVDLDLVAARADLAAMQEYWPASVIKPRLLDWMERSLQRGQAKDIRLSLSGDMDQFPFHQAEGSVEATFALEQARLDYAPAWPAAEAVDLTGRFTGNSMLLQGRIGNLGGVPVDQVTARIADFRAPQLNVSYATEAALPDYEAFLASSPLLDDARFSLQGFSFGGLASTQGVLDIPLGSAPGTLVLTGEAGLKAVRFEELRSGFELLGVDGVLRYSREGIVAPELEARYLDWPVTLSVEANWGTSRPFTAVLQGLMPAALLLAQSPVADDPLLAGLSGETDWQAEFSVELMPPQVSVPAAEASAESAPQNAEASASTLAPEVAVEPVLSGPQAPLETQTWLTISSSLEGVALGLPAPLDKPIDAQWPLQVRYPIKASESLIEVDIEDRLHLQFETSADSADLLRGQVQLGPAPGRLPPTGFFSLGGQVDELDLDAWLDRLIRYFGPERPAAKLQLSEAELEAQSLILLNRPFDQVRMSLDRRDEVLQAWFESQALQGVVRYNRNDSGAHSLWMEMERMLLPDPKTQAVDMDADPGQYPEIHLYAEQFRYLGLDLGQTRIEAYPVAGGLHFESVQSESEHLTFQARGDWLKDASGNRSDFDVVITSESLGSLVSALNLSSVLEGGQTMVRYNAWWPGPPAAFALSRLNGEMSFSVVDGRILNANPGAGRMLGLFSVAALPRRLAFDFRDVFESGFNFDQAGGTISLTNGVARTDDVVIESTAASLSVTGSSNLATQELDYTMSVRPGVSQALPVIGAIAAGPGGAAAGLALQGLLRQSLGDAAEARYQIQGPWSDPVVTRLDEPPVTTTPEPGQSDAATTQENAP